MRIRRSGDTPHVILFMVANHARKPLKLGEECSGRPLATLEGHAHEMTVCAVTPDGQRVISVSDDKTLKAWTSRALRACSRIVATAHTPRSSPPRRPSLPAMVAAACGSWTGRPNPQPRAASRRGPFQAYDAEGKLPGGSQCARSDLTFDPGDAYDAR
jgi:WD40 repeat protein